MNVSLDIEGGELDRLVASLTESLDAGFAPEMGRALSHLERGTDLDFRAGGRPSWKPHAKATVAGREALYRRTQGRLPAGGVRAKLRQKDALRKSVVDRDADGAVAESSATEAVRGTTIPYAGRQNRERPFLDISDGESDAIQNDVTAGLRKKVRAAERAARGGTA